MRTRIFLQFSWWNYQRKSLWAWKRWVFGFKAQSEVFHDFFEIFTVSQRNDKRVMEAWNFAEKCWESKWKTHSIKNFTSEFFYDQTFFRFRNCNQQKRWKSHQWMWEKEIAQYQEIPYDIAKLESVQAIKRQNRDEMKNLNYFPYFIPHNIWNHNLKNWGGENVKSFAIQTNINKMSEVRMRWEVIIIFFLTRKTTQNIKTLLHCLDFLLCCHYSPSFFLLAFGIVKKINLTLILIEHVSMIIWWLSRSVPLNFWVVGNLEKNSQFRFKATSNCENTWNFLKCFWLKNSFPMAGKYFHLKNSRLLFKNNFSNISTSFRAPLKVKQKRELVCHFQKLGEFVKSMLKHKSCHSRDPPVFSWWWKL